MPMYRQMNSLANAAPINRRHFQRPGTGRIGILRRAIQARMTSEAPTERRPACQSGEMP